MPRASARVSSASLSTRRQPPRRRASICFPSTVRERASRLAVACHRSRRCCSIAAILAALVLPVWQKREEAIALNQQSDQARQRAGVSDALRTELERKIGEYNFALERKYAFPGTVQVLDDITHLLPDDTWLTQLELRSVRGKDGQRELTLRGESANAGRLVSLLEDSKLFTQAAPRSPTTKIQPGPGEIFDVGAQLKPSPPPQATPLDLTAPPPPPVVPRGRALPCRQRRRRRPPMPRLRQPRPVLPQPPPAGANRCRPRCRAANRTRRCAGKPHQAPRRRRRRRTHPPQHRRQRRRGVGRTRRATRRPAPPPGAGAAVAPPSVPPAPVPPATAEPEPAEGEGTRNDAAGPEGTIAASRQRALAAGLLVGGVVAVLLAVFVPIVLLHRITTRRSPTRRTGCSGISASPRRHRRCARRSTRCSSATAAASSCAIPAANLAGAELQELVKAAIEEQRRPDHDQPEHEPARRRTIPRDRRQRAVLRGDAGAAEDPARHRDAPAVPDRREPDGATAERVPRASSRRRARSLSSTCSSTSARGRFPSPHVPTHRRKRPRDAAQSDTRRAP